LINQGCSKACTVILFCNLNPSKIKRIGSQIPSDLRIIVAVVIVVEAGFLVVILTWKAEVIHHA